MCWLWQVYYTLATYQFYQRVLPVKSLSLSFLLAKFNSIQNMLCVLSAIFCQWVMTKDDLKRDILIIILQALTGASYRDWFICLCCNCYVENKTRFLLIQIFVCWRNTDFLLFVVAARRTGCKGIWSVNWNWYLNEAKIFF